MNIDHLIKEGSRILREQNIFSYQIDSELLLSKIIKKDRVFILTNGNYVVSSKEIDDYLIKSGKQILDCVGCYQIEKAGPNIIENIKGDFFNVMGFPLFSFLLFLIKFNIKK